MPTGSAGLSEGLLRPCYQRFKSVKNCRYARLFPSEKKVSRSGKYAIINIITRIARTCTIVHYTVRDLTAPVAEDNKSEGSEARLMWKRRLQHEMSWKNRVVFVTCAAPAHLVYSSDLLCGLPLLGINFTLPLFFFYLGCACTVLYQ